MGVSLRTTASRWAQDRFAPWDASTNRFLEGSLSQIKGRLFRADRFTSIYHRPTRRAFIGLLGDGPESGVVKRLGTDEVYLVSDTAKTEVYQGKFVYDQLRQSHLVTPPSGGLGGYYAATTAGVDDDLGAVSLGLSFPTYLDLELQGIAVSEETEDVVVPRFMLTHSRNISPLEGDYFYWNSRWFLVNTPYIDGGLNIARASELLPAYTVMTYLKPTGVASGYDPVTGVVSSATVERLFSALIGKDSFEGEGTEPPISRKMELYIYVRHIGFTPAVGDSIRYNSKTYQVDSVTIRRDALQWKLVVSR